MVAGPSRTDDGWLDFDDLGFMDVQDDSEEKAAAEGQLNEEFGINVRDYKLINYWEEPDYEGDGCPRSPTRLEDRQMRARPKRCPLCQEVVIHQYVPYFEKGCFCHVLPGEECMCGHCVYQRNLKHPERLQEYLGERRKWEEDKKKKTPSQEELHKKIKEGYEQHLFNKYFLKQSEDPANETINQSGEVLEQTLALEASLNASINSLFDRNSSVRIRPLQETLPPRSGYSTVPGEENPEEVEAQLHEQVRRNSLVTEEIARRGKTVHGESSSTSAHTDRVRERVIEGRLHDVKRVTSASKVASKIRKMSKQIMSKSLPSHPEDLNETVVAGPGNPLNNSAPASSANETHVSFAPSTSLPSNRSGNNSIQNNTVNETLDNMSILEALEEAHRSLLEQMDASPELAQAVQEVCQAEQVVRDLSLSGSFDPEIVNQRRRHMVNLRKATVASSANQKRMNRSCPAFMRNGLGRKASRHMPQNRTLPNEALFPGPSPGDLAPQPAPNTSIRSNVSMRSNRGADQSLNQSARNRSQQLDESSASMNSSFDPAALHARVRQQLRDVLHNSQQVLNETLNSTATSTRHNSVANRSHVTQPPRPTSLAMTPSAPDESVLDPALLQQSQDQSRADTSLAQPQPFSRQNPHYQTNSASTPTTSRDRYTRFRTYMAQNNVDMTVIEDGRNNSVNPSTGNSLSRMFPNESRINSRNNTLSSSTGRAMNGTLNSSNNSTLHQSVLGDTTLTNLDDISYMGDVPVPRELSIHSTVRELRQALQTSVVEAMYRLQPTNHVKDEYHTLPAQRDTKCCTRSDKSCSGGGSGIVIEINANPTFVNNPSSNNTEGSMVAQIESMIMARQREFERHIEALCLRKLDAALARINQ